MTGTRLEGARHSVLAGHSREDLAAIEDPDGEEALAAYNRMLARVDQYARQSR